MTSRFVRRVEGVEGGGGGGGGGGKAEGESTQSCQKKRFEEVFLVRFWIFSSWFSSSCWDCVF